MTCACSGSACTGCACSGAATKPATDGGTIRTPAGGEKPKEEVRVPAPATIVVSLPADARLTIDDLVTTSTSNRRVFVSPTLNTGRDYTYSLKAEFVRDGKNVVITKDVNVRAGAETSVSLDASDLATVASR
jgi:uncharacterized protein (TIGR03000 family)